VVGGNGWFQLYTPNDKAVRDDIIDRVHDAGYTTLVVTIDVPAPSMRERQRRAGINMPPLMDPKTIYRVVTRPRWMIEMLRRGSPNFLTLQKYSDSSQMRDVSAYVGSQLGGTLDWEYLAEVRDRWKGALVIKGVLSPEDAKQAVSAGIDGIWVSNHGGRQFDGAPSTIEVLPSIVEAAGGEAKILFDSGVRTGLDIVRAIRLGADFVFMGRPFLYGVCALGETGGEYTHGLFLADLKNNMIQLGCRNLTEIMDREYTIQK